MPIATKMDLNETLEIPQGVTFDYVEGYAIVKADKNEVKKKIYHPSVELKKQDNNVVLSAKNASKREKKLIGTYKAHLNNMFHGLKEGFTYTLKICSGHFPMNVSVNNNVFTVKNLFGEKIPRTFDVPQWVSIKVEGENVVVSSPDKDLAGHTAASIEQLCRITNRDRRIFQDGIWIIEKGKR